MKNSNTFEALLKEKRTFNPKKDFIEQANIKSRAIYQKAKKDNEKFWETFANELHWFRKWEKTLSWKPPFAQWFIGGKINVSYNCIDRHIHTSRKNKAAIIWEGECGDSRVLTYWDLYREVNRFSNVLKNLGVKKGDRVTIYLPMIPELAIAMLACSRIGAPHSIVFGGFSAESLSGRINDSKSKVLITADGGYRRGGQCRLKQILMRLLRLRHP